MQRLEDCLSVYLAFDTYLQIGNIVINHREPNSDEARIQAMSVIAACSKGIMYFQSEVCMCKYRYKENNNHDIKVSSTKTFD